MFEDQTEFLNPGPLPPSSGEATLVHIAGWCYESEVHPSPEP